MSNPSLLCVPYRFKTSKLYSQIPDSALGDFTVTRATTPVAAKSTRVNASGLIELVPDNVPRLDYFASGGVTSCPALLVEPSAANGILNSTDTTTGWAVGANLSGTTIDVIGVSGINIGIVNGGSFITSTIGRCLSANNNVSLASGSTYTFSFLMKKTGAHTIGGYRFSMSSGAIGAGFDVSGSFASGEIANSPLITNRIRRVEQYGTDVYRCSETFTMTAAATATSVAFAPLSGVTLTNNSEVGTSIGFAAPQLELGSVPTSFIPTTTAAITRNADVISVSGAVSGAIGQTEGTIYAEVDVRNMAKETHIIRIDDAASTNVITLRTLTSNVVRTAITAPTTSGTLNVSSAAFTSGIIKIAFAYKTGDIALSVNGATALTANGTFTFGAALNRAILGSNDGASFFNDRIRAAALYTTRLTNAQLQSLTQ